MKTYLVGGAVRDALLGISSTEHDWVVVGATEAEMLAAKFKKVGKDFPVFLHPQTGDEYALARTERKVRAGYYGFECRFDPKVTLEEDLARRDLTINAMAQATDGSIVDPFGGQADLRKRILRHVSLAFIEDPVRVLRVARFAARFAELGFSIAPETLQLMQQISASGELDALVAERVWQEMERALAENVPRIFFETLRNCGALAKICPPLNKLWGVPQHAKYHPEIDTGVHVMMALDAAALLTADDKDTEIRFAVLFHDLGKGETPRDEWPSHKGHEERGLALIKAWCKKYKVPAKHRDLALQVSKWHLHVHKAFELQSKTIVDMFMALDAYRKPTRFEKFLIACKADARGRQGQAVAKYLQADYLRHALAASKDVATAELIERGYTGEKLGEQIRRKRIKAVKAVKDRQEFR